MDPMLLKTPVDAQKMWFLWGPSLDEQPVRASPTDAGPWKGRAPELCQPQSIDGDQLLDRKKAGHNANICSGNLREARTDSVDQRGQTHTLGDQGMFAPHRKTAKPVTSPTVYSDEDKPPNGASQVMLRPFMAEQSQ